MSKANASGDGLHEESIESDEISTRRLIANYTYYVSSETVHWVCRDILSVLDSELVDAMWKSVVLTCRE